MRRRDFLSLGAAAAVASALPDGLSAQQNQAQQSLLIRDVYVVSMDDRLGILDHADIYIENGTIRQVGRSLRAEAAITMDGRGLLAMPGFVDTHWHLWNSIARSYAPTTQGQGFFPAMKRLAPLMTPAFTGTSVELALAEAASCGITTVHNFAHNIRTPDHANAELGAMRKAGLRGRFSYGYPQDAQPTQRMDFNDVQRIRKELSSNDRIQLGIAVRGPERTPYEIWKEEWDFAHKTGLPITTHVDVSRETAPKQSIAQLQRASVLDARTLLVHLTKASDAEMKIAADCHSPVVVTPWTELRVGYGLTPWSELRRAGLKPALGVDTTVLSGNADFFSIMRLLITLESGRSENQFSIAPMELLRSATMGGAEALDLAESVGSLSVGKSADVLLVDLSKLQLRPLTDVPSLLVSSADSSCIRHVLAAGKFVKRDFIATNFDLPSLTSRASGIWRELEEQMAPAKKSKAGGES